MKRTLKFCDGSNKTISWFSQTIHSIIYKMRVGSIFLHFHWHFFIGLFWMDDRGQQQKRVVTISCSNQNDFQVSRNCTFGNEIEMTKHLPDTLPASSTSIAISLGWSTISENFPHRFGFYCQLICLETIEQFIWKRAIFCACLRFFRFCFATVIA